MLWLSCEGQCMFGVNVVEDSWLQLPWTLFRTKKVERFTRLNASQHHTFWLNLKEDCCDAPDCCHQQKEIMWQQPILTKPTDFGQITGD